MHCSNCRAPLTGNYYRYSGGTLLCSNCSEIDHPVCNGCGAMVLAGMRYTELGNYHYCENCSSKLVLEHGTAILFVERIAQELATLGVFDKRAAIPPFKFLRPDRIEKNNHGNTYYSFNASCSHATLLSAVPANAVKFGAVIAHELIHVLAAERCQVPVPLRISNEEEGVAELSGHLWLSNFGIRYGRREEVEHQLRSISTNKVESYRVAFEQAFRHYQQFGLQIFATYLANGRYLSIGGMSQANRSVREQALWRDQASSI